MLNEVLTEMSKFLTKERLTVLEWRLKHGDDYHVMAEAHAKAQMIAEMEYFYERLLYAKKRS